MTAPVTPLFKVKVAVEIVAASMFSLKVAAIAPFTATPVALLAGLVDETVGAVVSGAGALAGAGLSHDAMAMLKRIAKPNLIVLIFAVRWACVLDRDNLPPPPPCQFAMSLPVQSGAKVTMNSSKFHLLFEPT